MQTLLVTLRWGGVAGGVPLVENQWSRGTFFINIAMNVFVRNVPGLMKSSIVTPQGKLRLIVGYAVTKLGFLIAFVIIRSWKRR